MAARVAQERQATVEKLRGLQDRLEATDEFAMLTEEQQEELRAPFDALAREIRRHRLIAVMRDSLQRFQETGYPRLLQQMSAWATPTTDDARQTAGDDPACREPSPEYVTRASLYVPFAKPWLGDQDDVEAYLATLREVLLKAINEGKRIQV